MDLATEVQKTYDEGLCPTCPKNPMRCCTGCALWCGFYIWYEYGCEPAVGTRKFTDSPEAMKLLEEMKKKYGWSEKDGFWTKTGCLVPREERSAYCQGFWCPLMKSAIGTKAETFQIDSLALIKKRNEAGQLG